MARHETEGRSLGGPEFQEREDSAEGKEEQFQESTLEWQTYRQVEEALARLENGIDGHCLDCGMQIEQDRLRAVPWTPFCLKHQWEHEPAEPPFSL